MDCTLTRSIRVDSVDVTVFPLGTAVMKIFFKWIFDGKPYSVHDLYTWLFFSKIRHVIDGSFYGWILNYRKSMYVIYLFDSYFFFGIAFFEISQLYFFLPID
jgi:hypothetical protein